MKTLISVKTNKALGDFIKGTAALHCVAQDLKLDFRVHMTDIFKKLFVFEDNIHCSEADNVVLCENKGYDYIKHEVYKKSLGNSETIAMTSNGCHHYLDYPEQTAVLLKKAFTPQPIFFDHAKVAIDSVKDRFEVLHIRTDDRFDLNKFDFGSEKAKYLEEFIVSWDNAIPLIIICSNYELKHYLNLKYGLMEIDTKPVHSGSILCPNELYDTITDFAIMSMAKKIYMWSSYWFTSAFSGNISRIYNIPMEIVYRSQPIVKSWITNPDLVAGGISDEKYTSL